MEIEVSEIGQSYGRFRLIDPPSEAAMVESVRQYGQLSPVVVGRLPGGGYELVDGFKRFRALQQLGFKSLKATVLEVGVRGLKVAIIQLNWKIRSIAKLEEAMVLHSLMHDDGLNQVEIATLMGRHKSWVCRRIALIERLCDEAIEHIKLGLISATVGRELARLPRGNQPAALATIVKYRMDSRESARLVSIVLERPRWEHDIVLGLPLEILNDRTPDRPSHRGLSRSGRAVHAKLKAIEHNAVRVLEALSTTGLSRQDRHEILCVVGTVQQLLDEIKTRVN